MAFNGEIVELPIGQAGLDGNKAQSRISPQAMIITNNLTLEDGTVRKVGGASKYNSTAVTGTPTIIGGHDWHPTSVLQRMIICTSAGKAYKDSGDGTFPVTLVSGLSTADATCQFVDGGEEASGNSKHLFMLTSVNQVQVLDDDGTTMGAISNPAADWSSPYPIAGVIHEGRLWCFMEHRAYYSDADDHENFSGGTSGSLPIYPGVGIGIKQALSFKGLLVIFKYPRGIFLVDTSSVTLANWRVYPHSTSIGVPSHQAALVVGDEIIFMSQTGTIHTLASTQRFGSLSSKTISDLANFDSFMRVNANLGQLGLVRAIYYENKKQVIFHVPAIGSSTNDAQILIDVSDPQNVKFIWSMRDTAASVWTRADSDGIDRPVIGDKSGFVWQLDQSNRSRDGVGYAGTFQSAHTDLSFIDPKLATVRKNGKFLELLVEPKGNWDLAVDIYWDNNYHETILFNMGSSSATIGTFVLGTDSLGGQDILAKRKRITGSGKRISIAGNNSGDGQDFSIDKFLLYFTPGEARGE